MFRTTTTTTTNSRQNKTKSFEHKAKTTSVLHLNFPTKLKSQKESCIEQKPNVYLIK